jgi:hypothetical protein
MIKSLKIKSFICEITYCVNESSESVFWSSNNDK